MFDRLGELASEHAELERALADPAVHADPDQARTLAKRYAELTPIVAAYREWQQVGDDEQAARELAHEDSSFAAEADELAARREEVEERLRTLLVPKDPNDESDTILEVKAGEGGEESALFAGDLLRMYQRYAERHGWKTEIIDSTADRARRRQGRDHRGQGGPRRRRRVVAAEVRGRRAPGAARPGHRVAGPDPHLGGRRPGQPEADPVDVQVNDNDLRIDVFRSSGPGGQSVNTTDSAVRITHLPTGIVVSCQNEKSQLQNKEQALRVLRARLLAQAEADADAKASAERKAQVRTVDRSERVRTYNFPENRISDHRVGYKAYNLDQVIDGDLDAVIDALAAAELQEKLAEELTDDPAA